MSKLMLLARVELEAASSSYSNMIMLLESRLGEGTWVGQEQRR